MSAAESLARWERDARAEGTRAAVAAASWTSATDEGDARRKLTMLAEGDPEADVYLPARPDLSGEWEDAPTPLALARDVTGEEDPEPDVIDALCEAWEAGVLDVFDAECERILWTYLPDEECEASLRAEEDAAHEHARSLGCCLPGAHVVKCETCADAGTLALPDGTTITVERIGGES